MADFKFYLNRQGPKGEPGAKGEKGDNGNTPTFSDGINTPTVYTMQIDMGDGNVFETQNLKYPMRDDGGNYLRYDRTNSTVTLSAPNIADLQRTSGEVTLASVSDVENEDAQDTDAVSMELRNADQLALSNVINRIDRDIDTVDTKVDGEIQNRQNADTALGGRIDGLDSSKADKTDVYTKAQTDALLSGKANTVHTHNLSQVTDAGSLAGKNTVDYNTEVTNKPTIGNGTITITQGGVTKGTFTTNQSGNSTIALDAGGGGGATYTSGPGITINQNNEISVNVDNDTIVIDNNLLKANIPVVPTVNDATITITQGGITKGTFTTNQGTSGTIALDAGPDMSSYYTKTQTDSLLNDKISTTAPTAPLEYLPDTTQNLNTQNIDTTTMSFSADAGDFYSVSVGFEKPPVYLKDSNNSIIAWDSTTLDLINNTSIGYFETSFSNGINFSIKENGGYTSTLYCYVLGYYNDSIFNPVASIITVPRYKYQPLYFPNTGRLYQYNKYDKWTNYKYFNIYKAVNSTTVNFISDYTNGSGGTSSTATITQAESDELDLCTHIRIVSLVPHNTSPRPTSDPVYLSNIKIVNPSSSDVIVTAGDYTSRNDVFENGTNIFDAHPESLSIKYDSSTLGINSSGQLYALSSTPSNMVTTDTNQTITGIKTLNSNYTFVNTDKTFRVGSDGASQHIDLVANSYNSVPRLSIYNSRDGHNYGLELSNQMYNSKYRFWLRQPNGSTTYYDSKIYKSNSSNGSFSSSDLNNFLLESSMLDGTTITYNSSTGKISASANPPVATSSSTGVVQPDNSTITVDSNGVISAINNSIAKTAPIIPLKYEEQEDGVSTGIGGVLNHTNYTDSVDKVYVSDASTTGIYNMSGDGYIYQSATNMMSKIFYRGYKIRLDNGLNVAWNIAEGSGYFMNVAIGYYNSGSFVPVLYALNTNSYGGSMFARPALEFGSDVYDMGRLNTQFTSCVGISLLGNVLSAFSPTNGRHTYTISDTTLLTELQKCTHAICTVVNESSTGTTFNYSTGKFANPATTLSDDLEARNTIFSAAENLILNNDVTIISELKLNCDSTYFKVVNNQLTLDIQAIKDAIDALNSSSGTASLPGDLDTGGWD